MTRQKVERIAIVLICLALMALAGWYTHPVITIVVSVALVFIAGYILRRRYLRTGSAALVQRWKDTSAKHHGLASFWSILWMASWWTLRRQARVLKPSLDNESWWTRWRLTPITDLGTRLIKAGRLWVMASHEEHSLTFGGPRQGKSGRLAHTILEAPGAVLVTSTGADLIRNTSAIRSKVGPVFVFNPAGVGGLESTIGWNVLDGCTDPKTATERAADLLSATPLASSSKQAEWVERATEALAALMHAAALGNRTMHSVQRWFADPDSAVSEVLGCLRNSPEPAVGLQALAFFNAGRPRSSVCMSVTPALRWLTDPHAVAATNNGTFDVEDFLAQRGTLYLLADKDGPVAPIITALAGHVARAAWCLADRQPHERLEPPATLVLDEAPSICPLPIPAWSADMGKRNIAMHVGAQSLAQLKGRWGDHGAGALLTNCATLFVFGGTKDSAGLAAFTTLAGGAVSQSQLQQLPKLHAVVFRNGLRPVVGRPPMVWNRRDYRSAKRSAAWQPRLAVLTKVVQSLRPKRAAVQPIPGQLALPAAGTADREYDALLQQQGLVVKP